MLLRRGIILLFAAVLFISSFSAVPFQQGGDDHFPAGIKVEGEFYTFYKNAPDPQRMFGQPITNAEPDQMRQGFQVQYFERVRMDYDPNKPAGQRVSLANLGSLTYDENQHGIPVDFSTNSNMCRTFQPSGYLVCYAFLQLYDSYKGSEYFGQPISNVEYIDGRLVQYFEKVRMEWHAEDRPVGQRVVLSELGRINYLLRGGTLSGSSIINQLPMDVQAFVARPVAGEGDQQQVSVLVRSQKGPIQGARVTVEVNLPDNKTITIRTDSDVTNADGLSQASFPVPNLAANQKIVINVTAELPDGSSGKASTWFRTWW